MRRLALGTSLSLLALVSLARAGGTPDQLLDDESLLSDERRDVYVVEVVNVEDEGATKEYPPKVEFKVREAIRGDLKPGDKLPALWMPVHHDIDTTGREEALKNWKETPMKGPEKGQVFIVMDEMWGEDGLFRVSVRCRFEFSDQSRDYVVKTLKEAREKVEAIKNAKEGNAAAVAQRRKDDAKVVEAIDIAAAAKAAPVIVVGYLSGIEHDRRGEIRLLLSPREVLKGKEGSSGHQVVFNFDLKPTEDERLTLEARATDPATNDSGGWKSPRVIVFFNEPENPRSPSSVSLVNGVASVVPATPERLKQVREALGLEAEGNNGAGRTSLACLVRVSLHDPEHPAPEEHGEPHIQHDRLLAKLAEPEVERVESHGDSSVSDTAAPSA